jgi:hypothetical protein
MTSPRAAVLAMLFAAANALAQVPASKPSDPALLSPKDQVAAIDREFEEAVGVFINAYQAAKTDAEKQKLVKEKAPKPGAWFPRLWAIAKADPKGAGAEAALLWILQHDEERKATDDALDVLARDHVESPAAGGIAQQLGYSTSPKAAAFLEALEAKNPDRSVKAQALYARAQQKRTLGDMGEMAQATKDSKLLEEFAREWTPAEIARFKTVDLAKNEKEIEEILVQVQDKYKDVDSGDGTTLGDRAAADLFELRNLAIGKTAPDITGDDVDGKPLRLADFRGKVVVLDFWGNW